VRTHEGPPACVAIFVGTTICFDLVLTVASSDRKFRIALFHRCLMAGGIQRAFVNLARGFVERGLAVDLVQATPDLKR
jgi:hypothetical protein